MPWRPSSPPSLTDAVRAGQPARRRYRGDVRRRLLLLPLAFVLLAACSPGAVSRTELIDNYRRELVKQGIQQDQARCLTDKFFAELDDAELKAFQARDRLTDAEKQRFADLAAQCPPPA
jgi:hypothetical protein